MRPRISSHEGLGNIVKADSPGGFGAAKREGKSPREKWWNARKRKESAERKRGKHGGTACTVAVSWVAVVRIAGGGKILLIFFAPDFVCWDSSRVPDFVFFMDFLLPRNYAFLCRKIATLARRRTMFWIFDVVTFVCCISKCFKCIHLFKIPICKTCFSYRETLLEILF